MTKDVTNEPRMHDEISKLNKAISISKDLDTKLNKYFTHKETIEKLSTGYNTLMLRFLSRVNDISVSSVQITANTEYHIMIGSLLSEEKMNRALLKTPDLGRLDYHIFREISDSMFRLSLKNLRQLRKCFKWDFRR